MRPLSAQQVLLFGVFLTAALVAALFPFFPRQLGVSEGDVASRDVHSPRNKTFESDVLTNQARDAAALAVPPVQVYDPATQPRQLSKLSDALRSVESVRADPSLSESAKRARLLGIRDLGSLSRRSIDTVLALQDDRWQLVRQEAEQALTEVLGRSIPEEAVQSERDSLLAGISPDLGADEANLAADLIRPLVIVTLQLDEDATDAARQAARQGVQPVQQTIAEGQVIVQEGASIDATALELMEEVGLLSPRVQWNHLAAVGVVAALGAMTLAAYFWRFPIPSVSTPRNLVLFALLVAIPVFVAKVYFSLVLPDDEQRFLPYFLPLAVAPMLIATLLEARLAILTGLVQAGLLMFAVISLPDLALVGSVEPIDAGRVLLYYASGAIVGAYTVDRAVRANQYLLGGVLVAVVSGAILFALWLLQPDRAPGEAAWMTGAASVSGLGAGVLTAGAFTLVGAVLGVTTRVQLMELSQLNAPLLRRMQDEAPGTFHHSVIVGNLAERAADLIGADPLLVRVGCYYHDIGKVQQPGYYIENQLAGGNPHDTMAPHESARIISEHVRAGLAMAQQYRLPLAVQAFIPEHHGTRLIPFFYRRATQHGQQVDETPYRYPGPKPQSKETAIVMLADGTEAMVRASPDRSPGKIDELVERVLSERLAEGELEESDLTLRELRTIAESFKQTLRGVYHPRVEYPEPTEPERRALIGRFRPGRRPAALPPISSSRGRARRRPT
jgi:putative nucleotidyltransferase with HDIG domain